MTPSLERLELVVEARPGPLLPPPFALAAAVLLSTARCPLFQLASFALSSPSPSDPPCPAPSFSRSLPPLLRSLLLSLPPFAPSLPLSSLAPRSSSKKGLCVCSCGGVLGA